MTLHLFSDADIEKLKRLLSLIEEMPTNVSGRLADMTIDREEILTPETYIAQAPTGGIAALTAPTSTNTAIPAGNYRPGKALCKVWKIVELDGVDVVKETYPERMVFNFNQVAIRSGQFFTPGRDKYGRWLVPCPGFKFSQCSEDTGTGSAGTGATVGGNCCEGDCASSHLTLIGTVTSKVGCYTDLPDTFSMCCSDYAAGVHSWETGGDIPPCTGDDLLNATYCTHHHSLSIYNITNFTPQLRVGKSTSIFDSLTVNPESGYTCNPFSAVYLVDDGVGNSCTITLVS